MPAGAGRRRRRRPDRGMSIINVETGQLTRVPRPAPASNNAEGGGRRWGRRRIRRRPGVRLRERRANALLPIGPGTVRGRYQSGHWRRRRAWRGGAQLPPRRRSRPAANAVGATRHLHRQPRNRSQGAARAGLQRGLAHHEAPLLRREDARRRLERSARRPTSRCSSTWWTRKSSTP